MSIITRTFTTSKASVKVWDETKDDVVTIAPTISGKHDAESFKKEYSKIETRPVLKVSDVVVNEDLKGMTETEFLKLGKVFQERSKENRGMISKTIKTNRYNVKVWDANKEEIVDTVVSADNEKGITKNLPDNYKLLKIVSSTEISDLVCMDVETFWKYGRLMKDHFHFIED